MEAAPAAAAAAAEAGGGASEQPAHMWQWMWADAGTKTSRPLARANPLRWSKAMAFAALSEDLSRYRSSARPVELRLVGESSTHDFASADAAIRWVEQQQNYGDTRVEVDGVSLYDCKRASRQRGRLTVTATHLTFLPDTENGRKVSFPLHKILETRAVSQGGSPVKIEAAVIVPNHQLPAQIALEFSDRLQERDATLHALRRATATGSLDAIRQGLKLDPEGPKDDVVCDVLLRRDGEPESFRMVLGVDIITFEPGDAVVEGSAESITIELPQLIRIKSSDERSEAASEDWGGAGVVEKLHGTMMRLSFNTPASAPCLPHIELRIAVSEDIRAPKAVWLVEFGEATERDRVVTELQARRAAARSKSTGPSTPGKSRLYSFAGLSTTSIEDVVPERVEIVSMYKTDQGAKGRFVIECFTGGTKWQVIKRYSEFHALREMLLRCNAPIDAVAFPAKTWWSDIDKDMAKRREALEPWLNQIIQICTPVPLGMYADDAVDSMGDEEGFSAFSASGGAAMFLPPPAAPLEPLRPSTAQMDYSTASAKFDPTDPSTVDPHLDSASQLLSKFFSVEDVMESPGRGLTRAAGETVRARAGTLDIQWPADPTDSEAAVEAVLPALPCGVNCEMLDQLGGGPAKAGWMYLEKRLPGIGTSWGWYKRWFVVWPQTAHPKHGHLLFYFESESSRSAEGAIQLVAPVIRAPKSDREQYYSMRLNASQIRGVSLRPGEADLSLAELDTFDAKFILGQTRIDSNIPDARGGHGGQDGSDESASAIPEHGIKEWIHTLRNAGPEWRVREDEVSRSDWLLKRGGTMGVTIWQRRWVELRGLEMLYFESAGDHPSGCWNVSDYTLCLPVLPNAHRAHEFILVPTTAWKDGDDDSDEADGFIAATTGESHIFCAPSDDAYLAWRKALAGAGMRVATAEQLVKLPSIVGQWGVLASLGQSFGGRGSSVDIGPPMGSPEDFDVMRLVGQGGFGKVFLVKRRGEEDQPERLLAMKVMDKAQILEGNQEKHITEELSILAEVDHPFIITLEQAFHTSAKLYLVFEFMLGGDLYITAQGRHDGKYTEEESLFIVAEVTLALGHLHDCGIAFRDLKPENVLFDTEGHMRLTDFGLAKRNITTSQRDTACGTPLYMPPEAIDNMRDGGGYGLPVDWWMLGTLLYEMLFARTPFEHQDMHVLWSKIQMDKLEFPDDHTASPEAESILTQLLAKRPQDRLGAGTTSITGVQQVKGHAWFRHMDWEAMLRKEIAPPYIPTCDDPLAHFPKHLVDEIVRDADYKAPRARRAALRRTPSGGDPFADFNFVRPPPLVTGDGGGAGRHDLAHVLEGDEEDDDDDSHGMSSSPERRLEDVSANATPGGPLQMQWEFEVRDGWEAFGPADQRALALAFSTGKKEVIMHREPTDGGAAYQYRLDLQRMTQMNLGSGRQRKLRRLPAGRVPDAIDAAAGAKVWAAAAQPEPMLESAPAKTHPERFQAWEAGEGGEQEVVGDVDGHSHEGEPELIQLSSRSPTDGTATGQNHGAGPR